MPEGQNADFVVVNTCGFIDAARQESCAVIEEMLDVNAMAACGGSSSPAAWRNCDKVRPRPVAANG